LLPVLVQEAGSEEAALALAQEALGAFEPQFAAARSAGFNRKLGLFTERPGDTALVEDLLERMAANRADFTLTFRRLCNAAASPEGDDGVRALFADPGVYDAWAAGWRRRLDEEPVSKEERAASMRRTNPVFIPRNHLVEAALNAAVREQDFRPFEELLDVISSPYEDRPDRERYVNPARPEECVTQTFCGT
jgi:serine/tyrosine/threonine adenylyltransferase